MKLFVTGDTHGEIDIEKLGNSAWKDQRDLCREDLLIILGDFGFIWTTEDETERYWLKWLDKKPYRIAFLDGNHENHDRLRALETVNFHGGFAGRVSSNVWHLRRGEVYSIGANSIFVMGGALSIDKQYRREGKTWWQDEIPSYADLENARRNLTKHNWKVNTVLTHTLPRSQIESLKADPEKVLDPTAKMLEQISGDLSFDNWYAGHFHREWDSDKYHVLYNRIIRVI